MTKVIEAIFEDGVLMPLEHLELPERQRVVLTIQLVNGAEVASGQTRVELPEKARGGAEREAAFQEFLRGVESMNVRLPRSMPTRDELHER